MECYRTPDSAFVDLPGFAYEPSYLEFEGMRMHYVDRGQGNPILLLHGEPTWSYLYRRMIPPLAQRFRVIAPDYLGFGRSDKPLRIDNQVRAIGARAEPVLAHLKTLIPLLRADDPEAGKGHPRDADVRAVAWLQPEATNGERVGGRCDA